MTIGILTAMQSEHDRVASLLSDRRTVEGTFNYTIGTLADNTVILQQCGIGKVNAAVGTAELITTYHPDCIVSTGVAGGIDTSLSVMDVVVSTRTVHHDFFIGMGCEKGQVQGMPTYFEADQRLVQAAVSLNESSIHTGLICTGDQFITDRTQLNRIKGDFPAGLAVDMESVSIAQTCYLYGVPFVSFRIISDTPGADQHQQQYENFWGEMADRSFRITQRYLSEIPKHF